MREPAYRWVVLTAGGIMGCIAMGSLFSLPVLLTPMTEATGWSRTGISAAMTVAFLAMAFTSIVWGALSDRFGARPVVAAGSLLFGASLLAASQATSLWQFQAAFGAGCGIAVGAFFAPMMSTVTGWFTTRIGLAVSLVSAGIGLAPVTMSPLVARLIERMDWRQVIVTLAIILVATTLPLAMLLRRPPPQGEVAPLTGTDGAVAPVPTAGMNVRQALMSPQFIVIVLTNFLCCATHAGPIFHTVSYPQLCGIALGAAVTIYSVEGLAGMGGRIGFGVAADRWGAKRILVIGLLAQACGALAYYFVRDLWAFYVVAATFGFIYAGIMPLYNVLIRESFPMRMMGTIMGGTGLGGGLGMAIGPVLGGWIFDRTGSYGGLYLTSFALGLGAVLVAMTFRPFPKPAAVPVPA
ncbi:MFS transporter [Wenxinia marina]|uniref:Sugar phosphate permease n=1 Tax=Wenxinia marina DSM 24838 TaxID=1123501 RepID=A0A0D0QJ16_9RHOB|nr:MFS transporter [Wenxinia marina]KIQ71048.1 Sugar phosphate permease [Wenxinia marina DSM 24838]GGL55309.1 MFS transporter [Wenxinia marina]